MYGGFLDFLIVPLEEVLRFLNGFIGNAGLSIIVLTIIIKMLLFPLTYKGMQSSRAMQQIQPLIKELQKKYAKDREKLSAETMKLYKEYRINPATGCLPMLIQIPIFFALYGSIMTLSKVGGPFTTPFLWLSDLSKPDPYHILPILAVVFQFVQQRMMMPRGGSGDAQQKQMNTMMQFMPLMIGVFAWGFSAGPVIYWVASSAISAIQQYFITGWGSLADFPGFNKILPQTMPAVPPKPQPSTKPHKPGLFDKVISASETAAQKRAQLQAANAPQNGRDSSIVSTPESDGTVTDAEEEVRGVPRQPKKRKAKR